MMTLNPPIHQAMILAAGRGTRLGSLTENCPKPLVDVGGKPAIHHILTHLENAGITKVVINSCYLAKRLQAGVNSWQGKGTLEIVHIEEEALLDTGGGIANALPHFEGRPFLLVNGDTVWSEQTVPLMEPLMKAFDSSSMDTLLALMHTEKTRTFREKSGDFQLDAANRIHLPIEESAPYVYMCLAVLHPRLFTACPQGAFPLYSLLKKAIEAGRLYGYAYGGMWSDMGTPAGLDCAEQILSGKTACTRAV